MDYQLSFSWAYVYIGSVLTLDLALIILSHYFHLQKTERQNYVIWKHGAHKKWQPTADYVHIPTPLPSQLPLTLTTWHMAHGVQIHASTRVNKHWSGPISAAIELCTMLQHGTKLCVSIRRIFMCTACRWCGNTLHYTRKHWYLIGWNCCTFENCSCFLVMLGLGDHSTRLFISIAF